ncbi:MAG: CDP-diacylglycerol--glycerol-3-phosphate 3-phosphatidyltransferase [Pseudomonadota bacterium]
MWNLPNNLCLIRILMVPIIVWLLGRPDPASHHWAAVLFAVAATTDMLDGYLARRSQQVTQVGKLLDPLADKLLVSGALIMLIPLGAAPAWAVFIIIARELAVTGLRGAAACQGCVIQASFAAKYKTTFQIAAALTLMLQNATLAVNLRHLGLVLLWLALALTIWSGVDYFVRFSRVLSSHDAG